MLGFQQKITRHPKKQHFEETEQAPEPDSDMAEMWVLSDYEFKITMINMISEKSRQHERIGGQCKQRDGNTKEELKGNARNTKQTIKK